MDADVIIIGAGAAGLSAAQKILKKNKSLLILEARDRAGGRMMTQLDSLTGDPIELGAEFIHGSPDEILGKVKTSDIEIQKSNPVHFVFRDRLQKDARFQGVMERGLNQICKDPQPDQTVDEALKNLEIEQRDRVLNFVANFHAADLKKMGTRELAQTEEESGEETHTVQRLKGGYAQLVYKLASPQVCAALRFNRVVEKIIWQKNKVLIHTSMGKTKKVYQCKKVLITLPIGVLKANPKLISPAVKTLNTGLKSIHMGTALRMVIQFESPFWKKALKTENGFIHDLASSAFPVWWVRNSSATAWVGGVRAEQLAILKGEELFDLALKDFARLFGRDLNLKDDVLNYHFHNWLSDPFSKGSYSYLGTGGLEAQTVIGMPVENTLFFAGEGITQKPSRGTVQAAIETGEKAAQQILG